MSVQLPLALRWQPEHAFANFWSANASVPALLEQAASALQGGVFLLVGPAGSGKSHLLLATAQRAAQSGPVRYLPMRELIARSEAVASSENIVALIVDDVDSACGDLAWEERLFHEFNRSQDRGVLLLASSTLPAQQLRWDLADLKSRLSSAVQLQLPALSNEARACALRLHAKRYGLDIDDGVLRYLETYVTRDLSELNRLLKTLHDYSLARARKLTVANVRAALIEVDGNQMRLFPEARD